MSERNPVLAHHWGVCDEADRVWAQVAAINPAFRPWERVLVALQAFMDESYTANGCFVLAGYVATAESWAKFADEWKNILPLARRDKNGVHRFKMSEMAADPLKVTPFYRVIERHAQFSLSMKLEWGDVQRARERIWLPDRRIAQWGDADHPYSLAVIHLMSVFWREFKAGGMPEPMQKLLRNQQVEFVFDENTKKAAVFSAWEAYIDAVPEARELFGGSPRFDNDYKYVPLQAADLLAWSIRKAYETGTIEEFSQGPNHLWGKAERSIPRMSVAEDEDDIAAILMRAARQLVGPGVPIFDSKYNPRPPFETEAEVEAKNRAAWGGFKGAVKLPFALLRKLFFGE